MSLDIKEPNLWWAKPAEEAALNLDFVYYFSSLVSSPNSLITIVYIHKLIGQLVISATSVIYQPFLLFDNHKYLTQNDPSSKLFPLDQWNNCDLEHVSLA